MEKYIQLSKYFNGVGFGVGFGDGFCVGFGDGF